LVFSPHSPIGIDTLYHPVLRRALCWSFLSSDNRVRSGIGAEEHRLRHLDCLYLPEPLVVSRTWLLYPLAEYHQQRGNLAASQESGITKKTLIHVEETIWKCCINMLFCAIICILLFIKKAFISFFTSFLPHFAPFSTTF